MNLLKSYHGKQDSALAEAEVRKYKARGSYLNCSVQGSTGKLIVVLGVDDNLHNIMSVTLKHLAA